MSNLGQRTPTETLSHRLRLMADAGGMLSKDRKRTCIEAADRLTELEEVVMNLRSRFNEDGDEHEEH